jgi:hypothetical protein
MPVKAFVKLCNSEWRDPSQRVARPQTLVEYSRDFHHWTMIRDAASLLCGKLNSAKVHSLQHPEHHCLFDIEEVEPGGFAVLCIFHPEFTESESGVAEPTS